MHDATCVLFATVWGSVSDLHLVAHDADLFYFFRFSLSYLHFDTNICGVGCCLAPRLHRELVSLKLDQYEAKLRSQWGLACVGELRDLTDEDLDELGVKRMEKRRLRKLYPADEQESAANAGKLETGASKNDGTMS